MRIAIITTMAAAPWGGSEDLWYLAARAGVERGHRVMASVYRWKNEAARVGELRAAGVGVAKRPRWRTERALAALPTIPFRFRAVQAFRPDVILISQGGGHDVAEYPALVELREMLAAGRTRYVPLMQSNPEGALTSEATRERSRGYFGGAARSLFVADRNRRACERQLGMAVPNAHLVCNPVGLKDRSELPWPGADVPPSFAEVARYLAAHKGQDVLFEALADPRWRQREWRLNLFGSGPDAGYLERLIGFYGLQGRAALRGQSNDLRELWAGHHMLVLPSRTEGTPLAMMEAMLLGRPCLVSDVAGNAEWTFEPGVVKSPDGARQTGFVAEAPTAERVGAALERAWAVRERWREIGRAAREWALGHYDPDPGVTVLGHLEAAVCGGPRAEGA